jgi:CMP-N,N'-diacetyllegionaminic acid synthase
LSILGIIPARAGSKGIVNKNLTLVNGHPLLAWSIAAAKISTSIDRILVSTDSRKIAAVAKDYGAEVPFLRPAAIAQDGSKDLAFMTHALQWLLENEDNVPEIIVQLRPTSPLRTGKIIDQGIKKLKDNPAANSLRVVTKSPLTPYKMWRLPDGNKLEPLLASPEFAEPFNEPRQSLPATYWQIGTLDVIWSKTILDLHSVSGKNILGLEVPQNWAVDIDNIEDLNRASKALSEAPFNELENYLNEAV